jgi:chemotaxis protein MotB
LRRRRRRHRSGINHDRWLVSYADFITLLFAFFVVMYATAQVDKKKVSQLAVAITAAFQQMGAMPPSAGQAPVEIQEPVEEFQLPAKKAAPPKQEDSDLTSLRKEMEQALAPEISRGEVALRSGPDGLVISLRELGFFNSGSAGVKAGSQQAFSRMASLLAQRKHNIRIEGYTDNVPIHNSQFTSNWELSTARSTEMIQLLVTKYGFAPERLSAGGYGEYHPIATNSTAAGRELNRRVDLVILGQLPAENAAPRQERPSKPSPAKKF